MFEGTGSEVTFIGGEAHKVRTYGLSAILTVPEAAEFLRMNVKTVYQAVNEGTLPGRKVSGRTVILRDALLAYLRGEASVKTSGRDLARRKAR